MKKRLKKLIIFIAVLAVAFIALKIVLAPKSAEIGEKVKYSSIGEFTVNSIDIYDELDIAFTSLKSSLDNDEGAILVYFTFENTGKSDYALTADHVWADYNDGVKYDGTQLYLKLSTGDYRLYEYGLKLEKVTSEAEDFLVVIPVPMKVIEDTTESLEVEVFNHRYAVR